MQAVRAILSWGGLILALAVPLGGKREVDALCGEA